MSVSKPEVIVVTGANRGIGLGFVTHWLSRGRKVVGFCRRPDENNPLTRLDNNYDGQLVVGELDVTKDESVASAAALIEKECGRIDALVNNAGVYGPRGASLKELELSKLGEVFEVNAVGPLRVTRAFVHLLEKGQDARVAHLTSLMGSITDNTSGGSYPYRMSKAALNMANRSLAHELAARSIPSVVLHPGWVQTDMGGDSAPLSVQDSVEGLAKIIEGLDMDQSGRFFNWKGDELPW